MQLPTKWTCDLCSSTTDKVWKVVLHFDHDFGLAYRWGTGEEVKDLCTDCNHKMLKQFSIPIVTPPKHPSYQN